MKEPIRLRAAVLEWSQHARKLGGRVGTRRSAPQQRRSTEDTQGIRDWARGAEYQVSPRGRIAQEVRDAYRAAMG